MRKIKVAMLVSLLAFGLTLTSCFGGRGPSKAVLATQAAASIEEVQGLENKLIWLQANAENGSNYVIEINSDEKITGAVKPYELLLRKDNSNITITLRGVGTNRTISYDAGLFSGCNGSMFFVGTGTTLVLDNNITLEKGNCNDRIVTVYQGGTFVMNDGSAIINGTSGGVAVGNGIFLMKGGTISGNISRRSYTVGGGESAGKYFVDPGEKIGGGGVWVTPDGTFIKTGGTITGNSVEDIKKGLLFEYKDSYGRTRLDRMEIKIPANEKGNGASFIRDKGYVPANGLGNQIYFDGPNPKAIDTTVGPDMNFNFKNGVFSEE
jgi:hypothetical protein